MADNIGKPLGDRVLIQVDGGGETKTKSGLIIDQSTQDVVEATVVAVSDGFVGQNGEFIELSVKEGDKILVGSAEAGQKLRIDGKKYNLVRESEILMKV